MMTLSEAFDNWYENKLVVDESVICYDNQQPIKRAMIKELGKELMDSKTVHLVYRDTGSELLLISCSVMDVKDGILFLTKDVSEMITYLSK